MSSKEQKKKRTGFNDIMSGLCNTPAQNTDAAAPTAEGPDTGAAITGENEVKAETVSSNCEKKTPPETPKIYASQKFNGEARTRRYVAMLRPSLFLKLYDKAKSENVSANAIIERALEAYLK